MSVKTHDFISFICHKMIFSFDAIKVKYLQKDEKLVKKLLNNM